MRPSKGAPNVSRVLEGGEIRWPRRSLLGVAGNVITGPIFNPQASTVWLDKSALLARLEAEIDAIGDDRAALSSALRQAEGARVRAELLAREREEEALIASAGPGLIIWRRGDADPRAVLGLSTDPPGYAH